MSELNQNPVSDQQTRFTQALHLQEQGALEQAETLYLALLFELPNHPMILLNLGNLWLEQGQMEKAENAYLQSLNQEPSQALAWLGWGRLLLETGRLPAAEKALRRALQENPVLAPAQDALGVVLQRQGQTEQALAAFQQALALNPERAQTWNNQGVLYLALFQLENAGFCFQQALQVAPDWPEAWLNLAQVLRAQGQTTEAGRALERAWALRPDPLVRVQKALLLPPLYPSREDIEAWRTRFQAELNALEEKPPRIHDPWREGVGLPFYLAYQGGQDRDFMSQLARIYLQACPELAFRATHCENYKGPPQARIKIGFASTHLREHTIARIFAGMLAAWDVQSFERTVICFEPVQDALGQSVQERADRVCVLPGDFQQARQCLAALELDILIWLDLGMDPRSWFLAMGRFAPLQAVTWGHPLTSGLPEIDLFISNQVLEPEGAEAHYSERLLRLAHLHPVYPLAVPVSVSRSEFGLSEGKHLYLCPQSLFKFHPDFDGMLQAILQRDSQAELFVPEPPVLAWKPLLLKRWQAVMPECLPQIRFFPRLPQPRFERLLACADVILDPLHFGGGNTSYEALAQACPIVTLPGEFLRGRFTQGFYQTMGIEGLVASDPDAYVDLALALAQDCGLNQAFRAQIKNQQGALFENLAGLRDLEQILQVELSKKYASFC